MVLQFYFTFCLRLSPLLCLFPHYSAPSLTTLPPPLSFFHSVSYVPTDVCLVCYIFDVASTRTILITHYLSGSILAPPIVTCPLLLFTELDMYTVCLISWVPFPVTPPPTLSLSQALSRCLFFYLSLSPSLPLLRSIPLFFSSFLHSLISNEAEQTTRT